MGCEPSLGRGTHVFLRCRVRGSVRCFRFSQTWLLAICVHVNGVFTAAWLLSFPRPALVDVVARLPELCPAMDLDVRCSVVAYRRIVPRPCASSNASEHSADPYF